MCTASTSVLRRDPPQEPAKEQSGTAAADRTPTPKSVTEPPNTKSKNTQELSRNRAMFSLTVCSRTRKRKEYNLNVRPSKVRWGTLKYLVTFSLLAVTDLDTWLASSCTRAIIWSLLDSGAASDSLLAKLLMHDTAQCIANLERDLHWNWRVRVPSYTFPVVSPAAFIICTTFIFGDVLAPAIYNYLVA